MVSVGYRRLIDCLSGILSKYGKEHLDRLVVIFEFSKNKYDEEIVDAKIKNLYTYSTDERLGRIDVQLKDRKFFSVFKPHNYIEYGAFVYYDGKLNFSADLTCQIVVKDIDGRYGPFRSMYLRTNDYMELF